MIANLFVSTFLSLKAHKLRVFLTMVGIIIGITSVVTISALGEGMKRQVVKASSAVNADVLKIHYTMSDGSSDNFMSYEEPDYTFSRVDLKKLQDIQGIESIYPQYGESMMGGGDNLFVPMDYFGSASKSPKRIMAVSASPHKVNMHIGMARRIAAGTRSPWRKVSNIA